MLGYDYVVKYIIIGDSSVGKSNLLLRYVDKNFALSHDITIGVEFGSKIETVENTSYKLQIWDTAGQESFRSITRSYYRDTCVVFLVFSYNYYKTFQNLSNWLNDLEQYNTNKHILVYIVGNKYDLRHEVNPEDAILFSSLVNATLFNTSAKTNYNVDELFRQSIIDVHEFRKSHPNEDVPGIKPLRLNVHTPPPKTTCCKYI
jgi:Ras-related protein Rab-2A